MEQLPNPRAFNPSHYTPPLTDNFPSDGDWLIPLIDLIWGSVGDQTIELDYWQKHLIRSILERYPEGHEKAGELRFRQAIVSMGRQNGKSVLGAILGLYGLLRAPGSQVVGVASSADQARILYERTLYVINSNPELKQRFHKLTETRGIKSKDGSKYELKAAKGDALQGLPIDIGLIDELHIVDPSLYRSFVDGTGGRPDGIVVGITTAGDDNSELLKTLYEIGLKAIQGEPNFERFGIWIWESPEQSVPDDDKLLTEYLIAANPAIACGRLDPKNIISDIRVTPAADVIRYRLNRFVASINSFIDLGTWTLNKSPEPAFPKELPIIFSIDRSPDWGFATITANARDPETGLTHTEIVASIVKPNLDQLIRLCLELRKWRPVRYVVDGYQLKGLAAELKRRGVPVVAFTQGDVINASAMFHAKILQKNIRHAGDPLMSKQIPLTVRKNIGVNFRISRKDSTSEIDAVMSTAMGIYQAETEKPIPVQAFGI